MELIDLINVSAFTELFGFFLLAWASGYGVGYYLAMIRRVAHLGTN